MPTQYNESELGGISVETSSSGEDNNVEIIDSDGDVRRVLEDVTDLRNAKAIARAGETIHVYPGNYTSRNLLKDQVDWHFEDGAVIDNEGLSNGAFFENVGAHGSPGGRVRSTVTGQAEFEWKRSGNASGDAFLNTGASVDSKLNINIKSYSVPEGAGAPLALVGAADIQLDVDRFVSRDYASGSFGNYVLNLGSLFGNDNSDNNVRVRIGELDASERSDQQAVGYQFSNQSWAGNAVLDIEKLVTSETGGAYLGGSQTKTSEGILRVSVREHEGNLKWGGFAFVANAPVFYDNVNINVTDNVYSFYAAPNDVYFANCDVSHPSANASTGNFTVATFDNSITGDLQVHGLGQNNIPNVIEPSINVRNGSIT